MTGDVRRRRRRAGTRPRRAVAARAAGRGPAPASSPGAGRALRGSRRPDRERRPALPVRRSPGDEPGLYAMPTPGVGYKVGLDRPVRDLVPGDDDRTPDPALMSMATRRVRHDLTAVPVRPVDAHVCSWTDSPDGRFVIDTLSGGIVLACGDCGEGFKFSALMGRCWPTWPRVPRPTPTSRRSPSPASATSRRRSATRLTCSAAERSTMAFRDALLRVGAKALRSAARSAVRSAGRSSPGGASSGHGGAAWGRLRGARADRVHAAPGRRRRPRRGRVGVGAVRGGRRTREGPSRAGRGPRRRECCSRSC